MELPEETLKEESEYVSELYWQAEKSEQEYTEQDRVEKAARIRQAQRKHTTPKRRDDYSCPRSLYSCLD